MDITPAHAKPFHPNQHIRFTLHLGKRHFHHFHLTDAGEHHCFHSVWYWHQRQPVLHGKYTEYSEFGFFRVPFSRQEKESGIPRGSFTMMRKERSIDFVQ
jgi:hypothetical protein